MVNNRPLIGENGWLCAKTSLPDRLNFKTILITLLSFACVNKVFFSNWLYTAHKIKQIFAPIKATEMKLKTIQAG